MPRDTLTSKEYWEARQEKAILEAEKTAYKTAKALKKEYEQAAREVQKDVDAFIGKYAEDGTLSKQIINKRLTPQELRQFKDRLKTYYKQSSSLRSDPDYKKQLLKMLTRSQVSRVEALQTDTRAKLEVLYTKVDTGLRASMETVYQDAYYRTIFDQQQAIGQGTPFDALTKQKVSTAVTARWFDENFSERIWSKNGHKDQLLRSLNTTFVQGAVSGWHPTKIAREMEKDFEGAYDSPGRKNLVRLARTELNFISNQGTMEAYEKQGILEQYQYLATLDHRTSEDCQDLDLKVFDLKEAVVGINYPPVHPNCRSTTTPYIAKQAAEKIMSGARRIARDPVTNKSYYVPANMSYAEWRKSLTEDQGRMLIGRQRMPGDKEQFKDYKTFLSGAKKEYGDTAVKLFDGFPTRFEDFQAMKYLDPDRWEIYKENRRVLK